MKQDQLDEIVDTCKCEFGRVDILVNNAGINRRNDSLDFTEKDWDDVMNLNLKTVFFLSQRVARVFLEQGLGGKIINIASMMSYQGGIRVPSYTSSKSAIKGLTMTLANEWASMASTSTPSHRDTSQPRTRPSCMTIRYGTRRSWAVSPQAVGERRRTLAPLRYSLPLRPVPTSTVSPSAWMAGIRHDNEKTA